MLRTIARNVLITSLLISSYEMNAMDSVENPDTTIVFRENWTTPQWLTSSFWRATATSVKPKPIPTLTESIKRQLDSSYAQLAELYTQTPGIIKVSAGSAMAIYGMVSAIDLISDYRQQKIKHRLKLVALLWLSALCTCTGCKVMVDGVKA